MPSDDEFRNEVKSNVEKLLKNDGLRALLPPVSEQTLCQALRLKLLDFLCAEGVLDAGVARRMHQWRHSGFSVHNRVRCKGNDAEGRQRLARYFMSDGAGRKNTNAATHFTSPNSGKDLSFGEIVICEDGHSIPNAGSSYRKPRAISGR